MDINEALRRARMLPSDVGFAPIKTIESLRVAAALGGHPDPALHMDKRCGRCHMIGHNSTECHLAASESEQHSDVVFAPTESDWQVARILADRITELEVMGDKVAESYQAETRLTAELRKVIIAKESELESAKKPRPMSETPDVWLIRFCDGNFEGWWRANSSGYATDIIAAGRYTEEQAMDAHKHRPLVDKAVRLSDALKGLSLDGTVAELLGWLPLPDPRATPQPKDTP